MRNKRYDGRLTSYCGSALFLLIICGATSLHGLETSAGIQVMAIDPAQPQPGEMFHILLHAPGAVRTVTARISGQSGHVLSTFKAFPLSFGSQTVWVVPCVVSMAVSTFTYTIIVESPELPGVKLKQTLELNPRSFLSETITFDQNLSDLRTISDPRKTAESQALYALLERFDLSLPTGSPDIRYPLATIRKTAFFGDRREYRYHDGNTATTTHNGVDFGGNELEVHAPGSGTIVFAQARIVTGNTVILQHEPGVYSLFYHLSAIGVHSGQFVEAGTVLGKTGSTGLATGPHLHWELRCQGEAADPEALMLNGLIDTHSIAKLLSVPVFP